MRKHYTSIDPVKRVWNMIRLLASPLYQSLKDVVTKGDRGENSKPEFNPNVEDEATWSPLAEAQAESAVATDVTQAQEDERLLDLSFTSETREKALTLIEVGNWREAEEMVFGCLKQFGSYAREMLEAQKYREEDYFFTFLALYSKFAYLYAFCLSKQQNPLAPKVALFAPYLQTNPSNDLIEACQAITSLRYDKKLPVMSLTIAECFQETVKIALETGVLPS
ncbi:hypothetical protein EDC14_102927 [Hydrogenispora ethanolica]|uniref:Uncharacterized protein n=1 Tax=Hydrogenispora ethanolica TaxID=1082276 RepID=A0A4R1R8Q4_HYDET|nr:hypothetical protein [Hydrogenispora ethanolica]TCL61998.1 hypothetical protein EDC14_102927 [Hydrogenispora ethanolica]